MLIEVAATWHLRASIDTAVRGTVIGACFKSLARLLSEHKVSTQGHPTGLSIEIEEASWGFPAAGFVVDGSAPCHIHRTLSVTTARTSNACRGGG